MRTSSLQPAAAVPAAAMRFWFLLSIVLLLTGCTATEMAQFLRTGGGPAPPAATAPVFLRLPLTSNLGTAEDSAIIPANEPEIQEAQTIMASILERHGFLLNHQWDYVRLTRYLYVRSRHDRPREVTADMCVGYFQRKKNITSKGVQVKLIDWQAVFAVSPELSGIRDEIFEALAKKYGKEKVEAKWEYSTMAVPGKSLHSTPP